MADQEHDRREAEPPVVQQGDVENPLKIKKQSVVNTWLNCGLYKFLQKKGHMPTGQQRRKHQITYLIHQVSAIQIRLNTIDPACSYFQPFDKTLK